MEYPIQNQLTIGGETHDLIERFLTMAEMKSVTERRDKGKRESFEEV